ncbi:methyltransferase domain-containing protein [Cribrihabitans neustonicus]|uniref:methyltransferase domain-containing protein n=1 Tax=Cribrihabitans neustonicus TaxID=1429085 RepID=UPI003B5CD3FA
MDIKQAVLTGYSDRIAAADGAMGAEAAQVCRMNDHDPALLKNVPPEIIARDYGCGNPARFARPGDVVLDLGSGSGKICYVLAQIAGPEGRVIGVDMNRDMLTLARRHQAGFATATGLDTLRFAWGSIDDLASDLEQVESLVAGRRLEGLEDYAALQAALQDQRRNAPLIADASVDLVVSNCVINLVDTASKDNVLKEIYRVLRPGGRIALSDNVSNVEVPRELRDDPELWVGCYSGVYQEQAFYAALRAAGFTGLTVAERAAVPEKTIGSVTFQSVTVTAVKPLAASQETGQTRELHPVMYKGPWASVRDDAGAFLVSGEVTRVDAATAERLRQEPYAGQLHFPGDPAKPAPAASCCS